MFSFNVAIKRAHLRSVFSTLGESSLLVALTAKVIAAANGIESGQIVRSTSSSDVSVEFAEPGKGAPAPADMVEMWESLIADYELAVQLLSDDDIASPTDTQIFNKMLSNVLVSTTRYGGDFTWMRREPLIRTGMT